VSAPTRPDVVVGDDGLARCAWGASDPEYRRYHDEEWGTPQHDPTRLYEKLCLEGFQAGLSWITILRRRPAFREVFHGFDPERVAAMTDADVERLLGDARIIRHRGKIEATIANARATLALERPLDELLWGFAPPPRDAAPVSFTEVPATTSESAAMSRTLRSLGFRFVGPTTMYALMQSTGMVDDHLAGCFRATGEPASAVA
jgi:DNA-3-methyladenine glycosylase I